MVVVGGGLSGLASAAFAARSGLSVLVIEKAGELGGRARTTMVHNFALNLGAHAVYRGGEAERVLSALGVHIDGGVPNASGAVALTARGAQALPVGLVSMLTTGALSFAGKIEVSRLLTSLHKIDADALAGETAAGWIDKSVHTEGARGIVRALARVSTYSGALDRLSAGAAVSQMGLAMKNNVTYVHGGWQTLVSSVLEIVQKAGAQLVTGDGVSSVRRAANGVVVTLADGRSFEANAAIIAGTPRTAASIASESRYLAQAADRAEPVKVATLDVALSTLPRPGCRFALGTERPLYYSVHSAAARLAPEGGAVVHVMAYEADTAGRIEAELEGVLDTLQPGWRDRVVHRRFLPSMTAANALVSAAEGGFAGRSQVTVADMPGVFVAGDWVGPKGMLLDAALASAESAAGAAKVYIEQKRVPAPRRDVSRSESAGAFAL
ncbi:MAG: NAD(P)/FAD-dependent oxidoreductase [Polyangiaceae bacterium]|nr:NAD(P)/FAD-dependent oxidoreductase [Polyangiaceae bacterium]